MASDSLTISPHKKKENHNPNQNYPGKFAKQPWSQQCIVTLSCDSGWTGLPDVRFDEAGTSGDGGGGGDDDEDGISFLRLFADSEIAVESGKKVSKSSLYCFRLKNGDHHIIEWKAVLQNGQLYVGVQDGELPLGSKECFVSLLEYAEEYLKCEHVFVGLLKERPDRASLMRTFMFMGFETVKPNHELCPSSESFIFMVYTIE
ncbi:ornithine decarboxylase antizyme 1-like [Montipora foliosa]|uniref:ornithine decarboxylase antizyme 1-like n=1 Tax=Montipora foliosa TaxID=591990 RepID=UPI0035F109D9